MQSNLSNLATRPVSPLHAAIIMDGNGRWATARGLPRSAGHRAGAEAVRRTVEAAPGLGITTLTLYAFSSDNWRRPRSEVVTLMRLFRSYLRSETSRCVDKGVRLRMIGRRDRLERSLVEAAEAAERATAGGTRLHLRLAVDYSSREMISRAIASVRDDVPATRDAIAGCLGPEVDLLIRTGGEQRLSDFLLWESAYAELLFLPVMWPDFGEAELKAAIIEFTGRQRRFGALPGGESEGAPLLPEGLAPRRSRLA
jgi:undecaprenyl diphosphate synthase